MLNMIYCRIVLLCSMLWQHWTFEKRKDNEDMEKTEHETIVWQMKKKSYLKYVLAATVEHRGAHDGSRHVLSISHKNTLELVLT